MANKKISELPYIGGGKISGNTLVPLVTYFSAATGDTVHTYIDDFQTYLISGLTGNTVVGDFLPLSGGTVSGGTIFSTNGGTRLSIDTDVRALYDGGNVVSVDWDGRGLFNSTPSKTVDYESNLLLDVTGGTSVNWQNRRLTDDLGIDSADWTSSKRILYDNSGLTSIDWKNRLLTDSSSIIRVQWSASRLNDASGTQSMRWDLRRMYDISGLTSIDYTGRKLFRSTGGTSFDWENGILTGQTNIQSSTISATTYQNLPISGTHNYLSKFSSGSTILVDSQLRDNGSTVGLGIAPNVNAKLFVLTSSQSYGLVGQNQGTNGIGVFGQAFALGNTTGVVGFANGTSTSNIGVYGQANEATTNIGLKGFAFNGTNNYSAQLQDGTEGIGKVLTCMTSDGKANWQTPTAGGTFTGGTVSGATIFTGGLSANTFSATTYLNLPVTADTFTTAFTYSNNVFTISRNQGQPNLTATIDTVTGLTVNGDLTITGNTNISGGLTATTISATTYLNLPVPPFFNPGTASTINWDVSGVSNNYTATLTAATTTLNVSNIRNGEYATIILTQDSVGGRTINLGTINGTSGSGRHKVSSGGGGLIYLTSNPNAVDILSCVYDGNILYWTVGNDYN